MLAGKVYTAGIGSGVHRIGSHQLFEARMNLSEQPPPSTPSWRVLGFHPWSAVPAVLSTCSAHTQALSLSPPLPFSGRERKRSGPGGLRGIFNSCEVAPSFPSPLPPHIPHLLSSQGWLSSQTGAKNQPHAGVKGSSACRESSS